MENFTEIFAFLWSLLNMGVTIGSYQFTLGGAVIFAAIALILLGFLRWLFSDFD